MFSPFFVPQFRYGLHGMSKQTYFPIRNFFLDEWHSVQPRRINFRDLMKKHPKVGNVSAWSQVHKYLESIGVINVNGGVRNTPSRRAMSKPRRRSGSGSRPKSNPTGQRNLGG